MVEIVKKVNPKLGENKQEPEVKEYYNYSNADSTFFNKVAPTLIGYIPILLRVSNLWYGSIKRTY